jgi:hypothetical protein
MIIVKYELFLINNKPQHQQTQRLQQQIHRQHQLIFNFEHKIIKEVKLKYVFIYFPFILIMIFE